MKTKQEIFKVYKDETGIYLIIHTLNGYFTKYPFEFKTRSEAELYLNNNVFYSNLLNEWHCG